ncbi:MAG: NAD(P)H-dependent oxidoreductase [Methanobacteriota archaeon]|nr:MAG: NAD(P)H-dependent oxidoreductase [Euryarchaeota archaeon]
MAKILIVYDSRTGNTEKMAGAVADGTRDVEGAVTTVTSVDKAKLDDLLAADAIVFGSPTYYGNMSGKMKELVDQTYNIHGELEGKVGGAFTSSGGTACGAETALLAMLQAMLVHGMIVQGRHDDKHYGVAAIEAPDDNETGLCRELGKRVATLAVALKG